MSDPTTRPARRILAVVTIMRDDVGHYVVCTQTTTTRRTSNSLTRDDAIDAAHESLRRCMTDEEADRA